MYFSVDWAKKDGREHLRRMFFSSLVEKQNPKSTLDVGLCLEYCAPQSPEISKWNSNTVIMQFTRTTNTGSCVSLFTKLIHN